MTATLEALLFDVDGTLAETEELHRRSYNATFEALGLPWHWDVAVYDQLLKIAGGRERLHHYLERGQADFAPPEGRERFVTALHRDKTRRYAAAVEAGALRLRPGVERLIGEARAAGLRLGVATTTSLSNLEALLAATLGPAALGWFEVRATGETAARKKPAPDVYLAALRSLGCPAERALALEDSEIGLAAARAAGIPTLVTLSRHTRGQDFSGALVVVEDLGEPDRPGRDFIDLAVLRRLHAGAALAV